MDSHDTPPRSAAWLDLGAGWLFDSIRDAVIVTDAASGQIALFTDPEGHRIGLMTQTG